MTDTGKRKRALEDDYLLRQAHWRKSRFAGEMEIGGGKDSVLDMLNSRSSGGTQEEIQNNHTGAHSLLSIGLGLDWR